MEQYLGSTVGKAIGGSKMMYIHNVFDSRDIKQNFLKTLRVGCRLKAESLHHTQALGSVLPLQTNKTPMGIKSSWECFLRAVSTEISIKRGAHGNRGSRVQSYLNEVLLPSVLRSSVRFINDSILTAQNEFVIFPGAAGLQFVEGMPMHQCLDTSEIPDIFSTFHLMMALTVGTWTLGSVNREEGASIYVKEATLRVAVLSSSGFQFPFPFLHFLSSLLLPNYGCS